jgi:hypothetical protein
MMRAAVTGRHVRAGHVPATSIAANAGEVDADRDRVRLRELHGVTELRGDGRRRPGPDVQALFWLGTAR